MGLFLSPAPAGVGKAEAALALAAATLDGKTPSKVAVTAEQGEFKYGFD